MKFRKNKELIQYHRLKFIVKLGKWGCFLQFQGRPPANTMSLKATAEGDWGLSERSSPEQGVHGQAMGKAASSRWGCGVAEARQVQLEQEAGDTVLMPPSLWNEIVLAVYRARFRR